jgi:hypothetical protein
MLTNTPGHVGIMQSQYEAQVAPGIGALWHVIAHVKVSGLQAPETQSVCTAHPWPEAHRFGQVPPQSTSVSDPFFTPSVQLGA